MKRKALLLGLLSLVVTSCGMLRGGGMGRPTNNEKKEIHLEDYYDYFYEYPVFIENASTEKPVNKEIFYEEMDTILNRESFYPFSGNYNLHFTAKFLSLNISREYNGYGGVPHTSTYESEDSVDVMYDYFNHTSSAKYYNSYGNVEHKEYSKRSYLIQAFSKTNYAAIDLENNTYSMNVGTVKEFVLNSVEGEMYRYQKALDYDSNGYIHMYYFIEDGSVLALTEFATEYRQLVRIYRISSTEGRVVLNSLLYTYGTGNPNEGPYAETDSFEYSEIVISNEVTRIENRDLKDYERIN